MICIAGACAIYPMMVQYTPMAYQINLVRLPQVKSITPACPDGVANQREVS
jgi:hypothetical protein